MQHSAWYNICMANNQTPDTKPFLTENGLAKLQQRIDTLNRRAVRFGFPLVQVEVEAGFIEREKWLRDDFGVMFPVFEYADGIKKRATVQVPGFYVTVTGDSPTFSGWQFVAAISHEAAGNIIRNIGGQDLPDKYRSSDSNCEHCQTNRKRKDTYVVRHEDGRYLQVGKSCLKDFTGHGSPEALATWLGILGDLGKDLDDCGDEDMRSGKYQQFCNVDDLMAFAVMFIRTNGFVSRKEAQSSEKAATGAWVFDCLTRKDSWDKAKEAGHIVPIEEADIERGTAITEWVKGRMGGKDHLSEYEHNLYVALNSGGVPFRNAGLAVSAVTAYARAMGEIEERKKQEAAIPAEPFVGTTGQRLKGQVLTVTYVHAIDGAYGVTTFCRFADDEGHLFQWKASGAPGIQQGGNWHGIEAGMKVKVAGTVDAHGPDKYNKDLPTTFLKRCKLEAAEPAPAPRGQF